MIHVPPNRIDEYWPRVREGLQRIIDKTPYQLGWAPGDVLCALASQGAYLAIEDDGFMVWQRLSGDDGRGVLFVWALCCDDMAPRIDAFYPELEQMARDVKCKTIRLVGRKGWAAHDFWHSAGYVYEHEVK